MARDDDDDDGRDGYDDDDYDRPIRKSKKSVPWCSEQLLPVLTWICQVGFWLAYAPNLLQLLMIENKIMQYVCMFASILVAGVTLFCAVFTMAACSNYWAKKRSGWSLAGLASATVSALFCTMLLMCNCGSLTILIKSGHPAMPGGGRLF
jgi:hypothetical protein